MCALACATVSPRASWRKRSCNAFPMSAFPAMASATTAVIETLRELGIEETQAKTSEERGLL